MISRNPGRKNPNFVGIVPSPCRKSERFEKGWFIVLLSSPTITSSSPIRTPAALIGPGISLVTINRPCSFTVTSRPSLFGGCDAAQLAERSTIQLQGSLITANPNLKSTAKVIVCRSFIQCMTVSIAGRIQAETKIACYFRCVDVGAFFL